MPEEIAGSGDYLALTADIVSAFVGNNSVPSGELPEFIAKIHGALRGLGAAAPVAVEEAQKPAVPVKKSVTPDYIVCLEDGLKFKSLKRHLRTKYSTPPARATAVTGLIS